jgi:Holliday junction resolvase RusA-like endonuclease
VILANYVVDGIPVPKGSARAYARIGRDHLGRPKAFANVISDTKQRGLYAWERAICVGGLRHRTVTAPYAGAVRVRLEFVLPRPKALRVDVEHTKLPDLDKLIRAALDGMTGAIFIDDKQVRGIDADKRYAARGEEPHLWIRAMTKEGDCGD